LNLDFIEIGLGCEEKEEIYLYFFLNYIQRFVKIDENGYIKLQTNIVDDILMLDDCKYTLALEKS
jgi:hypothetical protein